MQGGFRTGPGDERQSCMIEKSGMDRSSKSCYPVNDGKDTPQSPDYPGHLFQKTGKGIFWLLRISG